MYRWQLAVSKDFAGGVEIGEWARHFGSDLEMARARSGSRGWIRCVRLKTKAGQDDATKRGRKEETDPGACLYMHGYHSAGKEWAARRGKGKGERGRNSRRVQPPPFAGTNNRTAETRGDRMHLIRYDK